MRRFRNSLRTQILSSVFVSLAFLILSMSYIVFTTQRLQELVNNQFRSERFLQELQRDVIGLQEPLLTYLSSRSSSALATLLVEEQTLRDLIPDEHLTSNDPLQLTIRRIYSLLSAYLDQIQEVIAFKRGREVAEYTALYEEMGELNAHIVSSIDAASLAGLRRQLDNYEIVIDVSQRLQLWNLLVIVSAFLYSIFWMLYSINRVTNPMQRLAEMAGELSAGNFDIEDIRVPTVSEVGVVVSAFNNMKHDIRDYMEERLRNLKMEQVLKRMEVYTLRAQMNPHFLFNTLNTGVQLAITEQADRTADFMEHLALFFRNSIRERKLIVPLRQEVEGLESYLYLLRIRFRETLSLSVEVDESLLDTTMVPALVLQPLVENSGIHAFRNVRRKGSVEVRVRRQDHDVVLTVADNGDGMSEELARELLGRHAQDSDHTAPVTGLKNVIQRLHFFYPSLPDVVRIQTAPGSGTTITICIDTRVDPCIPS